MWPIMGLEFTAFIHSINFDALVTQNVLKNISVHLWSNFHQSPILCICMICRSSAYVWTLILESQM